MGVTFKKGQAGVQKNTTENAPQWRTNITDLTYIVPYVKKQYSKLTITRMWVYAQRDGHPGNIGGALC